MARSLSSLKLLAASVSDGLSFSFSRRGYSYWGAAAGEVTVGFGRGGSGAGAGIVRKADQRGSVNNNVMKMMKKEECSSSSSSSSAWGPDPVTGYYRPGNCAAEIDAAELREMLLNHKVRT